MTDNLLISVRDLKVYYDSTEVIKNASFDILCEDFIGIIGPNGGGKTTLIKAILKSIPYNGKITYTKRIENSGHRYIGYLPQITKIDKQFPISVIDVVLSGLQSTKGLFRRYQKNDYFHAEELFALTNISPLKKKKHKRSFGWRISAGNALQSFNFESRINYPG